jgi:hypothetical protein
MKKEKERKKKQRWSRRRAARTLACDMNPSMSPLGWWFARIGAATAA